ncbi:MAG TPA: DUF1475 family protein [Candidatus Bathyarchaeia archaeon]|nr:DUF1475 family protein [Candidatus Bathyarchaeia archaeon]
MKNIGMLIGKIFAILGILGMVAGLSYGFIVGDFLGEGSILLSIPWGIITLVDIYISFIVYCGWIIYREKSVLFSSIWTILVLVLGSFTVCLYLFIALQTSKGSWQRFWHGRRAEISDLDKISED